MKKEARFWHAQQNSTVQCELCPHTCIIKPDHTGICGVRKNEHGTLQSLIYAAASSIAVDPIEKKPLYHVYPASNVLSFGTVGCNFSCLHCQNASISTATPVHMPLQEITPEAAIALAHERNCQGIAWTYNEPTIWHEYTFDTAQLAKQHNLYTVYVTNGYINSKPLQEIAPYLDAMNIDVKAFQNDFYKKICKAELKPVLETCILAKKLGIHIELTYLVIPQKNDNQKEINEFCNWVIKNLDAKTPIHFTRFHPDHHLTTIPRTPMETMQTVYTIAKKTGLQFVYLGNIPHNTYENTICPTCQKTIIERIGFTIQNKALVQNKCKYCGTSLPLLYNHM